MGMACQQCGVDSSELHLVDGVPICRNCKNQTDSEPTKDQYDKAFMSLVSDVVSCCGDEYLQEVVEACRQSTSALSLSSLVSSLKGRDGDEWDSEINAAEEFLTVQQPSLEAKLSKRLTGVADDMRDTRQSGCLTDNSLIHWEAELREVAKMIAIE